MAKSELYKQILVSLPGQDYPIHIGENLLADPQFLRSVVKSRQVLIVSNETVAPLYMEPLKSVFADRQCDVVLLRDGEQYKNQESLTQIYDRLISASHHRDTCLIGLGGGVVGDITGFAASTYQRGVGFVLIPTTLLAQVDASVGGKTAINHPLGKNMIGSFYQPDAVIIDVKTLASLPKRERQAGFAEVIKYAILKAGDLSNQIRLLLKDPFSEADLLPVIAQCCAIKVSYVQDDEKEQGRRALLNLGHTIGHALEAYTCYERWLHGEAVAIGLYCIALLSREMGYLDQSGVEQVDELLKLAELPRRIPIDINLDRLTLLMAKDKKIKNNKLRFILIKKIGECFIEDKVPADLLQKVLKLAVEGE
ncbi:3-dehydroquinate synthase [Legionella quinlivanii]|uniref:3-dehydroquinate synthase n=1 Tax=Legionella quinlivanii TaxID=45073 RepID=A0A0W0Y0Z4_9GAMM|nr:3-dehydroquinate synthase [Legionella quinlivanii]KTD50636.1 3-dehydroquinate synthase [Legionella quinlivanii]SEG35167.1 3-dehydroquinate synthase [Legionella quinlivanii DSM 21216]STY11577.1 3-dehydroquinate synthase [Legionella quinlivanii]